MPRFYFDMDQSDERRTDREGELLDDLDAARRRARVVLLQLLAQPGMRERQDLAIRVRGENGVVLTWVTLEASPERRHG